MTPAVSAKVISYRKYRYIDKDAFIAKLWISSLVSNLPVDVEELVDIDNNTLRTIIDKCAF